MESDAHWILTVGNEEQLKGLFNGQFLKGHREHRVALVGRSNVGKSSLINSITRKRLAQTSNNPGKTRLLHFYKWKERDSILVDLPGYGFAKTSQEERDRWAGFINSYLTSDPHLKEAWVLLDARHGPTPLDREAIDFLSFSSIPVTFVMTKSDALKTQKDRAKRSKEVAQAIQEMGFDPESAIWVSSKTGDGISRLLQRLKKE